MCSTRNLAAWLRLLLPEAGPCAQAAAGTLVRALLVSFTTVLADLARQSGRETSAKITRTWLSRWLTRPHWEPERLYAQLNRQARRLLARRSEILLLIDFTDLGTRWRVLQVSLPWQGRAIPLYRSVVSHTAPEIAQPQQVQAALSWLQAHLPGELQRYLMVLDRGFPSHPLIRTLQALPFGFVVRATGEWKLTHPEYTGQLKQAGQQPELLGPVPRCLVGGVLGNRRKGRDAWSQANVVFYHGEGNQEAWYLLTSVRSGARAVRVYRERMQIECEFRDLKGPWGLDQLARWHRREAVACLLALIAIYEWRLVYLWLHHRLWEWRPFFQVKGKLSWITTTRLWIQHQLRPLTDITLACL
jgi:DDE family transposase